MQIQKLSDADLLFATKRLAQNEREILVDVIRHLREVDRRRLFSSLKYKSIHEYAVKELKYSDDQAYYRVKAARMVREIPEIEDKIGSGELSLSALSVAISAIRLEAKRGVKVSLASWLQQLWVAHVERP